MLRTIFAVGIMALLGLFLLSQFHGIFGFLIGFLMWMLALAVRIAVLGLIVYFVIRIVSPDTARRMRERWGGSSS